MLFEQFSHYNSLQRLPQLVYMHTQGRDGVADPNAFSRLNMNFLYNLSHTALNIHPVLSQHYM
jgi:hypothetical protein